MVKNYGSITASFTCHRFVSIINQNYIQIGDLKFGELKGTDRFGNKYYEDLDLPYGQHRWVEYADIHNFDPTNITPEYVYTYF